MAYSDTEQDALLQMAEGALVQLARLECERLGLTDADAAHAEAKMREEVNALPKLVAGFLLFRKEELAILAAREARRYDPGPMMNETFERAQKNSRHSLTPLQMQALDLQRRSLAQAAHEMIQQAIELGAIEAKRATTKLINSTPSALVA